MSSEDGAVARRGVMLVLSSPSGAGKSTIARSLLRREHERIELSISVTTRQRRPSEIDGVDYHFVSVDEFEAMRERGELLEWAEVHGNLYATPARPVDAALDGGRDVLFDIDWQGTLQLYEKRREDIASVFILPPSMAELKARLERRAEDAPETITRRLKNAGLEMKHWPEYDYVIVNHDLEESFQTVWSILQAERARRDRGIGLAEFVTKLRSDLASV